MQAFDDIMRGFRAVFDDGLKKSLKGVALESKAAADSLDGLEKSVADINKATNRPIKQFQSNLGLATKAIGGASAAAMGLKVFGDQVLKYNDAARMAVRGTSLLGRSVVDTDAAIDALHKSGVAIKMWMGGTVEEASLFARDMHQEWSRTTRDDSVKSYEAIDDYGKSLAKNLKAAGIGPEEARKFHSIVAAQANLTMKESGDVLDHITKAAIDFGVAGPDSIQHLIDSMDTVNALDAEKRAEFLKRQIESAALQKKAAMDLGKYVSDIGKKKGADAFKEYAKMAALTGKSLDQVTNVMRGTDAKAKINLQTDYVSKFGDLDRYQELLGKANTGSLGGGEASEMLQMEMRHKSLLDGLNLTIEDVLSGRNKADEGRFKEDPAVKLKGSFDNLNTSLENTSEMASRLDATIQKYTISGLEALGGSANSAAGFLRTIGALSEQKGFGMAAGAAGWLGIGALMNSGKLLGGLTKTLGGLGRASPGSLVGGLTGKIPGLVGEGMAGRAVGMAGRAAPPAALAWAAVDTVIAAAKMTSEGGRKDIRDRTEWSFDDGPMAALDKIGSAMLRPGQAVAGMLLKQEATMADIGNALDSQLRAKKAEASFEERSAAYHARKLASASLKEVSRKATGPSVEKATDVKVTPTSIRNQSQSGQKNTQVQTEQKLDTARLLQKVAEQPNTLPVLAEIRDLLNMMAMNGGSIA